MVPRLQQVMRQTRARIFEGVTDSGKIVSLFEHTTEIIRKGKAGKPTEFGKMIKVQEAENQIITSYQVYEKRPSDSDLLVPAIEEHQRRLGQIPRTAAADAGFYAARNDAAAQALGVQQLAVPNLDQESGAQAASEKAMVPQRPKVEDRLRGPHQRHQAEAWVGPAVGHAPDSQEHSQGEYLSPSSPPSFFEPALPFISESTTSPYLTFLRSA